MFSLFSFRQSFPRTIWDWLILFFLLLCTIFFLMPIYVMVVTGLKQAQNVSLSTMWHLPTQLSGGGFLEAWRRLYPNLGNSLQLTIPATIFSSIFGAVNGYIFAKWKFRGSNTLFALLVFGMFIPYQSILIPLIQFLEQIKLYGTIWGLVLVHVIYGLPICSLIFRNFFANIASVGGCELGLSDAAVDLARAVERQGIDDLHEPRMCVGRTFVQTIGFETVGADAGALAQHHHCRWHQAFHRMRHLLAGKLSARTT